MTVASGGRGPVYCKVLSLGPLIKSRIPWTIPFIVAPMQRVLDDPRSANCQVYLLLWAGLFESLLHLSMHHPSSSYSDPLQSAFFHPNVIVTSLPNTQRGHLGFPFRDSNICMQKRRPGVGPCSAPRYRSHNSWIYNDGRRWPTEQSWFNESSFHCT